MLVHRHPIAIALSVRLSQCLLRPNDKPLLCEEVNSVIGISIETSFDPLIQRLHPNWEAELGSLDVKLREHYGSRQI